ncbi:MAG TPA: dephospho-CoA kinase [Candidatus Limnocylindrales bacterium]|nr:dephospho-CoA kinase [Candidatus Limnocylindrales bacterium]
MRVLGLTGGIGSGKSTVARMFTEQGAFVVDADQIAREIVRPGEPALRDIVTAFGRGVLQADGSLDRLRLGDLIFHDAVARATLNAITHPRIRERLRDAVAAHRGEPGLLVLDVPLLFESGRADEMEATVLVWVDHLTQLRRLVERDGLTLSEAAVRLAAQMPLDDKRRLADHVIDNSRSLEDTRAQVEAIAARYLPERAE